MVEKYWKRVIGIDYFANLIPDEIQAT